MTKEIREAIKKAIAGEIAVITHPYNGPVPGRKKVDKITKVMCANKEKLLEFGRQHGIPAAWLHVSRSGLPHFDLWGTKARRIERKLMA